MGKDERSRPVGKTKYQMTSIPKTRALRQTERVSLHAPAVQRLGIRRFEYNEPRGHHYMVIDQLEIDASRLKAGGACLTCKTPFAGKLQQELGASPTLRTPTSRSTRGYPKNSGNWGQAASIVTTTSRWG